MILAALVLAQAIALDPSSGVWFPPDGRRDDYLDRKRSYSQDLKHAFEDAKVMNGVCSAVAATAKPGKEVDPRLQMMRMTLDMACIAAIRTQREKPQLEERAATIDTKLGKTFDDAAAFAATIPADQRKATQRRLLEEIDDMTEAGPLRARTIVQAIVLRPQDARGAWLLLRAGTDTKMSSRELAEYVEHLYRSRAAAIGPEAPDWEAGLREVLLYLGKDEEALRLTQNRHDRSDYDRMLLATLEAIRGNDAAIDAALAQCDDVNFCHSVVWSVATRTARIRTQLTPATVTPIVERTIAWYEDDWPARLESTRILARLDPKRGRAALTKMYATPAMPDGALLDALHIDAELSFAEKDHLRTIALRDCWLVLRDVTIPPLAPDAWTRFAALPEPARPGGDGCAEKKDDDPILTDCTTRLLTQRMYDAMYIRDWPLAQQSIEKLLAHVTVHGLAPTVVRGTLAELAITMSRDGDANDAARIVRYLDAQELPNVVKFKLDDAVRKRLPQSSEVTLDPWSRAADDPSSRLPHVCGN